MAVSWESSKGHQVNLYSIVRFLLNMFVSRVGNLTGFPDLNLASEWKVADTLFVRTQHGLPVFDWASANNNTVINYLDSLESWGMWRHPLV